MALQHVSPHGPAQAFLHGRGVVHGDLTAENILLKSAPSNPHGFTAKVYLLTSSQPPYDATLRVDSRSRRNESTPH